MSDSKDCGNRLNDMCQEIVLQQDVRVSIYKIVVEGMLNIEQNFI